MKKKAAEIVADVKAYLEYLKEMGIEELPVFEPPAKEVPVSPASPASQGLTLEQVRAELGNCQRCKLHKTRRTIVFGEGDKKAKLLVIGEGPGYEEDVQGKPFVGKAGQLLTKILQAIHLERDQVYIANVIKCRPPMNRNPEPDEIKACWPFLEKQVSAIQPKIICALGTFAAQTLLRMDTKITALRGKVFDINGIKVIPTYHPAYLLRNADRKKEVWEDMKRILELL